MKRLICITAFICSLFPAKAQDDLKCLTRGDTTFISINVNSDSLYYYKCNGLSYIMDNSSWEYYRNLDRYIPDMDSTKPLHVPPIKNVNLNINIIQKDDGTGNLSNNYDTRRRLREMISWINARYARYSPSDPIAWVTELPNYDSRIRFTIGDTINERIYFYNNTSWWSCAKPDSIMSYIHTTYPEREEAVNVIIYGNPGDSLHYGFTYYPSFMDFSYNQTVNTFYWNNEAGDWGKSNLLAHELGHVLGLWHTYDGYCDQNYRDFLKDVFVLELPDSSNCPHHCIYDSNAYAINGDGITNNLMGGNKASLYISPMQAGIMHRTLSMYSTRKYVTCEKSEVPLVITDEELWDFNMKLYQDLIIESGAKVTLTCHLIMHPDTKIIIKPGGTLIVDGATISNDIFEQNLWQGIEVWGNSSLHQEYLNGHYLQGDLELMHGATIENAICAVELWNPNDPNSTGGIIHARDAIFRNNAKAVHALNYTNYYPENHTEALYKGSFKDCEFVIDSDYPGTETFNKHVDLAHVNGLIFDGCDFSADRSVTGVSPTCKGIAAYGAGFTVTSHCDGSLMSPCPTNNIDHCTFTGFHTGVLSVNDGNNARSFNVSDAVFTNNKHGIFAQNTGNAVILDNEFNIGNDADCSYGVYAEGVIGFSIEENTFRPATGVNCTTYGIGVFNTGGVNDIYKNTFENLTCANLSYGVNHTGFGRVTMGLTYSCNENTGNQTDFSVLKDNGSGGIQSVQGSMSAPAGNTFSGSQYHFYNNGDFWIDYYYSSTAYAQTPNTSISPNVNAHSTANTNPCYSHYGNGGVLKSSGEKAALADAFKLADDECKTLEALYDSQIAAGITPKPELVAQMAQLAHDRNMAAGDIVRSDLNDSISNIAELREWLGNMNTMASDRLIVASYIQEGDFNNALALAGSLKDIYNLQGNDLSDHNDYMKMLNLYQALHKSNRTVHEMTDDETKLVTDIAEKGFGTSRLMAKAVMMEVSDGYAEPCQCIELPDDRGFAANADAVSETTDDSGITFNVSPIPATTWISVEYKLPEKPSKATMTVMNLMGVKMMTVELAGNHGTKTIDLRDLPSGVYILKVTLGDGSFGIKRIIKQ